MSAGNDFNSTLDEVLAARAHDRACPGRIDDPHCTCGATAINYVVERCEEMRQALLARNDIARECADLQDQVARLTARNARLEPLATAARDFVNTAGEGDIRIAPDGDFAIVTWQSLIDAVDAWYDSDDGTVAP